MNRNRGFSLIELIVVVAILAIAASLVVGSFNLVYVKNMQSCASRIDALLSKTKICAMTRAGSVYLRIYQGSDGIYADYCEGGAVVESNKVGKSTVALVWNDGTTDHALADQDLCLSFDRSTGAFTPLGTAFTMYDATSAMKDSPAYCVSITLSSGGASRVISLIGPTGKHLITAG